MFSLKDPFCIWVWNLGLFTLFFRLCYVQSLAGHKSPVTAVSASETTGDIATVCDSGIFVSQESCLDLQTQ